MSRIVRAAAGGGLTLVMATSLAACSSSGGTVESSSTSTLPPLPPSIYAYVTLAGTGGNLGFGNHVVAVDVTPGSESVGSRFGVGTYPDAVALDGSMAYVANYTSNTVTPVDLATGKSLSPIPVGVGPAAIAISKRLDRAYVTDDGSASTLGDTVTPIDLKTRKTLPPIKVGAGPQGIAITPDGLTAYVANAGAIVAGQTGPVGDTVTPLHLATATAGKAITVGNGPTGIAVTPDGGTVFVTNLDSLSVTPINVASNQALAAIPVPGGPIAIVVARGYAWVVDTPSNSSPGNNIVPISVASDKTGQPIPVKKGVQGIAVTPGDTTAWVTCLNSDVIQSIDLTTKRAGATIPVPGGPFAIAIAARASGGGASPGASQPGKSDRKKKGPSTHT